MKGDLIPNPEYETAPFALGYIPTTLNIPERRFRCAPPADIMAEPEKFYQWALENEVPSHITEQ